MRTVLLGFTCNNGCGFCAQGSLREHVSAPDFEALEARTREVARDGGTLAFVGGEPTLHPSLPSLIRLARASGAARVVVQTNARRLRDPAFCAVLAEAGVSSLDVSLVGSTAAMHDFHTRAPGSFLETIEGLKNARQSGIAVGVSTVITRSNFRHLAEILRIARELGAKAVHLCLARPEGSAKHAVPPLVPSSVLVEPYLVAAARAAHADGLGVVVESRASDPRWLDFFARFGAVES